MDKSPLASFTQLKSWQKAYQLAVKIHHLIQQFPKEKFYSLTNQMRRCTLSISSNIAESFSRQSKQEKRQFYSIAKGSLTELQNQLLYVHHVSYLTRQTFNQIVKDTIIVSKLITQFIKHTPSKTK